MTTRRIDRALEEFRAGERDLYTEDGQKLYSDEEHERRHEALLERFDCEKDSAVAEADRVIEKSQTHPRPRAPRSLGQPHHGGARTRQREEELCRGRC